MRHRTHLEIVHVHAGTLTVGDETMRLSSGDSALFKPELERVFANEGNEVLRYCQSFTVASRAGT